MAVDEGSRRFASLPLGVWAIGFVSLLMDVSSEMIHALLPVYLVTTMHSSTLMVGVIEGIAEATAAITKVFSGALADWYGRRKPLALLGYGLAAVTKPVFPLAPTLGWVVAARFIDRIGKGIRGAPRDALVADITPPKMRGAAFGLRQSLDTAGAFLGPLIAMALLLLGASMLTVFWVAVIPALLAVLVLAFAVADPPASIARPAVFPLRGSQIARLPAAFWLVTALAALFTLARFSEAFLMLKAQSVGLPIAIVPLVMVVMNFVYALAAYPAGVLSDGPHGRMRLLVAGFALLAVADTVLALATGIAGVMIGVVLWGLHMGLTQGVLSTLVADSAPAELRGTAFGLFNLVSGVALLLASLVAGALWDWAGPSATFLAGAGLTLAGLIVAFMGGMARQQT